jgi:hypothetical protein
MFSASSSSAAAAEGEEDVLPLVSGGNSGPPVANVCRRLFLPLPPLRLSLRPCPPPPGDSRLLISLLATRINLHFNFEPYFILFF